MKFSALVRVSGVLVSASLGLAACAQPPEPIIFSPAENVNRPAYPWLAEWTTLLPAMAPVKAVFPAPAKSTRVELGEQEFGAWLRGLPVRLDRTRVLGFSGEEIIAPAAAVILLDLGQGDLQQCADTILRLYAEYLWSAGTAGDAAFHFTSGDLSSHADWRRGERFVVRGSEVRRVGGEPREDGHSTYRAWLQHLFMYAGTLSLGLDSLAVGPAEPIRPGDFFVSPGSPGHAVIVLDVVRREDGSSFGLIGQGFTPAQELHVIRSTSSDVLDGVWFPLPRDEGERLDVPSWASFPRRSCRRFGQR